jgi:GntR family transcriptional regulator/MocR family aminotransferase
MATLTDLPILIDRKSSLKLHRQLFEQIRSLIVNGILKPDTKLPPSRVLGADLSLSRSSVNLALEQLVSEGYLISRQGSGFFVSASFIAANDKSEPTVSPARNFRFSKLSNRIGNQRSFWPPHRPAFSPGVPDLDNFPFNTWSRLLAQANRRRNSNAFSNGDSQGMPELRTAIADHLVSARGVSCSPDQVMILSGGQQALRLIAQLLANQGENVAIEDPGYPGAKAAFISQALQIKSVPVDQDGIVVEELEHLNSAIRFVCVTPTHQFPLGVTLSLERRLALLSWAERQDSWIIEDDYDSDFRFKGPSVTALQGLDRDQRVIYVGSFSKTLFPGLRVAYLVAPPELIKPLVAIRHVLDGSPSTVAQLALSEFIADGHFARHLRKMKSLYGERQNYFTDQLEARLSDFLKILPSDTGMHLATSLTDKGLRGRNDIEISVQLNQVGISAPALSSLYQTPHRAEQGLLFGFAATNERETDRSFDKLVNFFNSPA